MTNSLASEIKSRMTLRDVARLCSIELPERDNLKFASPFRPDRAPSCTIHGERFKDWSTDESLDAIDFYAKAKGISVKDSIVDLGRHIGAVMQSITTLPVGNIVNHGAQMSTIVDTHPGTIDQHRALYKLRGFSRAGQILAERVGILSFGTYKGHDCWFVGDGIKGPMQARRLDGQMFAGERKALTLPGTKINHLVGFDTIGTYPNVLLVEGGPDLLAGLCTIQELDLLSDWCVVGLLGAQCRIPPEQAQALRGRRVRICSHPDRAGMEASLRWVEQLGFRAEVLSETDGDLNDMWKAGKAKEIFE